MNMDRALQIEPALPRLVQPEVLDGLHADDPAALRARRDLRRLHHVMGTLTMLSRALDRVVAQRTPRRILELGAGDGSLVLRLAKRHAPIWPDVEITLLDRRPAVGDTTLDGFRRRGWTARVVAADVFDWLETNAEQWDLIVTTLFLHHFPAADVARLLQRVAPRTQAFVCCEPRRSAIPLVASHLVALLGAGPVTREDAVVSVHAGFVGNELSAAWPDRASWELQEYAAGLFSHCLVARRKDI